MYIVSRCLLGHKCKYDGGDNRNEDIIEFCGIHDYVTVCPETAAGLPSPRVPAEQTFGSDGCLKVIDRNGEDVTDIFDYGARLSLASVMVEAGSRACRCGIIEGAILKANSPSCGAGAVYDGTFTHTLRGGNGIFTDMLIEACLKERDNLFIPDDNRLFSDSFRIYNEDNFHKIDMIDKGK